MFFSFRQMFAEQLKHCNKPEQEYDIFNGIPGHILRLYRRMKMTYFIVLRANGRKITMAV